MILGFANINDEQIPETVSYFELMLNKNRICDLKAMEELIILKI